MSLQNETKGRRRSSIVFGAQARFAGWLMLTVSSAVLSSLLLWRTHAAQSCYHIEGEGVFDEPRLDRRGTITNMPTASLCAELDRIRLDGGEIFPGRSADDGSADRTIQSDVAECREALIQQGFDAANANVIASGYRKARLALNEFATRQTANAPGLGPAFPAVDVPEHLPAEFALYLRGVIAWRWGDLAAARGYWQALLDLPPWKRQHRSTWAAYMLAEIRHGGDHPADRARRYQLVRTLAREGFADSTALACASLGQEARIWLDHGDPARATRLYIQQYASGDVSAAWSIRTSVDALVRELPDVVATAAKDERVAAAVTGVLLARGKPYGDAMDRGASSVWLEALEKNAVNVAGADRVAWAAYLDGQIEVAVRWVGRSDPESPISLWLRAKFAQRQGQYTKAGELLARAVPAFSLDPDWGRSTSATDRSAAEDYRKSVAAEAGELKLSRLDYIESLRLFIDAADPISASYVAERVLTVDELKAFVDADCQPRNDAAMNQRMRRLLGRRLVRVGRATEGVAYLDGAPRGALEAYLASLTAGIDVAATPGKRADALFKAAMIARKFGLEIMGTELAPDWAMLGGNYENTDIAMTTVEKPQAVRATRDECERVIESAAPIPNRWHYRYFAADLAWSASQLMPDDDERTAEMLCVAGSWLKDRDPHAADRFYKSLVRRCGHTQLGALADTKHWFPKMEAQQASIRE